MYAARLARSVLRCFVVRVAPLFLRFRCCLLSPTLHYTLRPGIVKSARRFSRSAILYARRCAAQGPDDRHDHDNPYNRYNRCDHYNRHDRYDRYNWPGRRAGAGRFRRAGVHGG